MSQVYRVTILALAGALILSLTTSLVFSQPVPPGGQPQPPAPAAPQRNYALQFALDVAAGKASPVQRTSTTTTTPTGQSITPLIAIPLVEVSELGLSPTARRPPQAPTATSGLTLAVTPRSNGCPNVYPGSPDNIRVNQDCSLTHQGREGVIASNPADPTNLIAGYGNFLIGNADHCTTAYSLDRGRTWGERIAPFWGFLALDGHTFDLGRGATIAFDSRGNAYFACYLFDLSNPPSGILVTKSNAEFKGPAFHSPNPNPPQTQIFRTEPPGVVANDNNPHILNVVPSLAADQSPTSPKRDRVYVAWFRQRLECGPSGTGFCESPIYFSESRDGGATWSPGIAISGANPDLCGFGNEFDPTLPPDRCNFDTGPSLAVGADGTHYAVFRNNNPAHPPAPLVGQHLLVRCPPSKDCTQAASWEGPFKVADGYSTHPFTCPQNPGSQCLPPNSFIVNVYPSLALDRSSGKLYVAWADFRNGGPCATDARGLPVEPCANHNNDVFLTASSDGGTTWSPPSRVNQDTGAAAQTLPWVAVAPGGTLYVSYYDRRYEGCETFGCLDISLSTSIDGGTSWHDQRITTKSMPGPESAPTAAGGLTIRHNNAADQLGALMIWADTRGLYGQNERDAYFAAVDSRPPPSPSGNPPAPQPGGRNPR